MIAHGHSASGGRAFFMGAGPSGVTRVGIMCALPHNGRDATLLSARP